jgi:TPR repeat protein
VQGAQPAADQALLGELVAIRTDRVDDFSFGNIVVTSLGTSEKTYRVTTETKIIRDGYASTLRFARRGDTASLVLHERGPRVKFLTLTSKKATVAGVAPTAAQTEAKKKVADERLLKWHQDLAAKGDPRGLYEMAKRYQNGNGVETNAAKAQEYFGRSAEGGNEEAKLELKRMAQK